MRDFFEVHCLAKQNAKWKPLVAICKIAGPAIKLVFRLYSHETAGFHPFSSLWRLGPPLAALSAKQARILRRQQ
jgi:hypothetical protein